MLTIPTPVANLRSVFADAWATFPTTNKMLEIAQLIARHTAAPLFFIARLFDKKIKPLVLREQLTSAAVVVAIALYVLNKKHPILPALQELAERRTKATPAREAEESDKPVIVNTVQL